VGRLVVVGFTVWARSVTVVRTTSGASLFLTEAKLVMANLKLI
jgi:hypothetical protein